MNKGEFHQQSYSTRGYMISVLAAAILSTTAIFIRYLTQRYQIPALVLALWRDIFVVLTVLPILGCFYSKLLRVRRGLLYYLVIYGFVLALFNAMWTISVALNGAAAATVMVYSSAAFTAILGRWFLNERLGGIKILAIMLCLTGCFLVSEAWKTHSWYTNSTGIITGILSGLCYSLFSLMGRSASQRGLNPWTTLLYTFLFASFFLLILNMIPGAIVPGTASKPSEMFWLRDAWVGWGVLFLLGAGPTVAGFGLYLVSLKHLPASVVNLIVSLEPVFTTLIAYVLLGEQLTCLQLIGGALIMTGVICLRWE